MHNPNKDHWKVIKWILRYVKGSLDECLVFNKSKTATYNIIGFVDSNCSGDLVHRHSISSYNFTLCVGAISSKAFLQSIVVLSTTEAEYIATTEGVKEVIKNYEQMKFVLISMYNL